MLCLQLWLPAPDPPILGDPAVGTWGLAPPASIQDYLGPCRVEGSVILSGTSHCVCMAVTSRGLAGLLPGPGNLALSLPDERDRVQKKTFTKWVNSHLARVTCRVGDLYSDLRDGRNLLRLLEVLSGETLVSWGHRGGGGLRDSGQGDRPWRWP